MNTSSKFGLESLIQRRGGLLAQDLGEDLVMSDIESGQFFGLPPTARRIWQLLEKPMKVEALCAVLAAEYEVGRETLEKDLLAFLEDLRAEGLIEPACEAQSPR